ncbi:hypothetical protein ACLK18_18965 [Escherichia coli]
MKLWVTHSQFIADVFDPMTTLAREHRALPPELAQEYLQSCRNRHSALSAATGV